MRQLKLIIKLRASVTPGAGEGWGGIVDSDVVYDDFGLPYIPARRIKGILKENAVDIVNAFRASKGKEKSGFDHSNVVSLFGKQGQEFSTQLHIDNAYLPKYAVLGEWLRWAQKKAPDLANSNQIISTFTHIRNQTAIDNNGIAKDTSLRFTRALNRDLQFETEIHVDKNHINLLALSVRVMRSMGTNRNRGFGAVECSLIDENEADLSEIALREFKPLLKKEKNNGQ